MDYLLLQENKPDVIFYNMPIRSTYSEDCNFKEAVVQNVLKTDKLIKFAQKNRIPDVFILSTTKALNANTWVGATQRLGEIIAQFASSQNRKFHAKFHVIRIPDETFDQNEIYGEILCSIKTNGYLNIKSSEFSNLQNESDIYPAFVKSIVTAMKNEDAASTVLTINMPKTITLNDLINQACINLNLNKNKELSIVHNTDPHPMDLDIFPNISEIPEKTSSANIFMTPFVNTGNEHYSSIWTEEQISKMSTREIVSAVLQSLNDKIKAKK